MFVLLTVLIVCSCSRGSGYRRDNPEDDNNTVRMVENPYWKLYYDGRLPVEDGGNWYMCDIVGNDASDSETYYLSVLPSADFASKYASNVYKFCIADMAELKKQGIALSSGSSEVYFDVLDENGGVEYTAIAYGVGSDGKLTGSYKKGIFSTEAITARETDIWTISYTGREKDDDGAVVDVFDVKATSKESYRVDVTYDDFLKENYNGDLMTYFNALADNLFAEEVSLDYGSVTYMFDRLLTGVDWTAYAVGFDVNGNPTGRYAKLDFVIPSETPTEEFLSWLGKWKIGSGKVGELDNNGKLTVKDQAASYDITIVSNDPNWEYEITGWETGSFANGKQGQWDDGSSYYIYASYDREKGTLVFNSQNVGWGSDSEGDFDIMLYGNLVYKGGQYFCTDMLPVAEASHGSQAGTATVNGLSVRAIMDDATTYDTEFTSMQLYDVYSGKSYYYNTVPQFPLNMSYMGAVPQTATKAAAGDRSVRRKASVHERTGSEAPAKSVRSLTIRKASGVKDEPKAEKSKSNTGQAFGTRAKVN